MSKATYLLILTLACITTFALTPAWAADNKNAQPATLNVDLWDYCDPATFGAALCSRSTASGAITLSGLLAELNQEKSVGAWRFAPSSASAAEGTTLMLKNMGGETHTFTRVRKFGGGFVAVLNTASGNPVPAPECAQMVNGMLTPQPPSANNIFLAAGATATGPQLGEGETARFQCCIHPWMRITIHLREHDDDSHHE